MTNTNDPIPAQSLPRRIVDHDDLTGEPIAAHDAPHRAADDTEQVYFNGSPLLRAELGKGILWILAGLVIIAIPFVLRHLSREPGHIPWWLYLAAILIGLLLIAVPWLKTKTVRYRISNYRVDHERGLFSRTIDTLELWHVEDIQFHQSFSDRLLGVGSITIVSHDETTPRLLLRGLPNPRPLFESLKQRVIAVKRQRGVVKMDVG